MKKLLLAVLACSFIGAAFAQDYTPRDYKQTFNDISVDGITKEQLFQSMDRSLMRLDDSVCANRALMWLWDIKDKFNVDAGKVFVFYTGRYGAVGRTDWWYHVAPVVNEKGSLWVMEGAYPDIFDRPLTVNQWFKAFIGTTNCKEIGAEDTDLIERMLVAKRFPSQTSEGKVDCYYKIVPSGYAYPASVAMNLLGKLPDGTPTKFEREHMDNWDVYTACMEAANSRIGNFLGFNKRKCKKFAGLNN